MKEFTEMDQKKPCEDCFVTSLKAWLEYPNGQIANVNTGMWLHHVVLVDFLRPDLACAAMPYRFFASGNERTKVDFTAKG